MIAAGAIGGSAAACRPTRTTAATTANRRIQHVLLISVDGLHQSDLEWYVANHPGSELAKLTAGGAEFIERAHRRIPSDSDPGGTALMTGGDPRATGVYYDVEYNHADVRGRHDARAHGQPTGGDVIYDSPDDKDDTATRRRPGDPRPGPEPGPDHADDRHAADAAESGDVPGRPDHLPADLSALLPEGQHDLRGRARRRPAHRVVGQAPGVRVVQRPVGPGHRRLLRARDRLERDRAERHAVPGRHQTGPTTTPRPGSTTATRSRRSSTRSTASTTAARTRSARRRSSG